MNTSEWSPIARKYDPILAGSIDATDIDPHDRGIVRALNSCYKPNIAVQGDPECTVFIGRLNYASDENRIRNIFSKCGQIRRFRLVRDFITGFSKGYCFVEYTSRSDAKYAINKLNHSVLDDRTIIVMFECERNLTGWIPRRFGGGLGGKKESGQLRFGGAERPFRKPILIPSKCNYDRKNYIDTAKTIQDQDQNNGNKYLFSNHLTGKDFKGTTVASDINGKETRNKTQGQSHTTAKNSKIYGYHRNTDKITESNRLDHDTAHKNNSVGSRKRSMSRESSQKRFRSNNYSRKTQNLTSSQELVPQNYEREANRSKHNRNSSYYREDLDRKSSKKFVRSQLSLTPE